MVQLSITRETTPAYLTLDVVQDPFDPGDRMQVIARVFSINRAVLAAHTVTLRGLEQDYLDTLVEAVVNSYRWGNPATDLAPAMRRVKRDATRHASAQQRR